jgi:hypothetical protein
MDPNAFGIFSAIFSYLLVLIIIVYFIRACRQRRIIEEPINEPLIIFIPSRPPNNGSINNQSNSYQNGNTLTSNKNYTIVDDPSV